MAALKEQLYFPRPELQEHGRMLSGIFIRDVTDYEGLYGS